MTAPSPAGTLRVLLPALTIWGVSAAAITHTGVGGVIAIVAALSYIVLIVSALVLRVRGRNAARMTTGATGWSLSLVHVLIRSLSVLCALLVLVGARIDMCEYARGDPQLSKAALQHQETPFTVQLTGFPRSKSHPSGTFEWVSAKISAGRGSVPVLVRLKHTPGILWGPGTTIELRGVLEKQEPSSSYAFVLSASKITHEQPHVAAGVAAKLRHGLRVAASALPTAALVPGFAVGDTSLVSEHLEESMLESSLTHLVAVSGANCALITGAIVAVASRLGAGRRLRVMLAGAALSLFVFVVGPDASVQRASVMAAVILASNFGGKHAHAFAALGVAIVALLIANPWQALHAGFSLSVAATAGILMLAPAIERGFSKIAFVAGVRAPRWLVLPVAVACAAQIACGPLLLLLQPGLPAAGILANVLAAPAAPLGTGIALIAMLMLPVWPQLGNVAVWLASLPASWVSATAEITSRLPLARWYWPSGWQGSLLLAGVELAVIIAWALATGRITLPGVAAMKMRIPWQGKPTPPNTVRVAIFVLFGSAAGTLTAIILAVPVTNHVGTVKDWSVVACDVGQGDAILLRDPVDHGATMLVDTGDNPELLQHCLNRFGVTHIDLLVLTHDDRDHVGALEVAAPITDYALVAPDTQEQRAENASGARRTPLTQLQHAGVPFSVGEAGVRGGSKGLRWQILAPQSEHTRGVLPEDANAASIVMLVQAGNLRVLMLADTGASEHRELLRQPDPIQADVVKVAHHGSGDQDPALLDALHANIGLVSVGAGNGYGHPSPSTLQALQAAGTRALRTDRYGCIALSGDADAMKVWVERGDDEPR